MRGGLDVVERDDARGQLGADAGRVAHGERDDGTGALGTLGHGKLLLCILYAGL
jgi:hypothetical protein